MKFSKAQKDKQVELNEWILANWDDAISRYYEKIEKGFDFDVKPKRLFNCQAEYFTIDKYVYLKSYNTIVAVFDIDFMNLIDVLRYVYGYTATSAQHISKFYNLMRQKYSLYLDDIEIYRYYNI